MALVNQLDEQGHLKHFISIKNLEPSILLKMLEKAEEFIEISNRPVKNIPILRGKTIANLFFEPSTRTRTSFELAAKRLSADILNINIAQSATRKGETLIDTLRTLEAMHSDLFIVRHANSGAAHYIAEQVSPQTHVINAGDGCHEHPTQAVLDMYTIKKHKQNFKGLSVAIVGNVLHSRVAHSDIYALSLLNVSDIRVIAPDTLCPTTLQTLGVHHYTDMYEGLRNVDVIIMLRLQQERMNRVLLPSQNEYFYRYGLTKNKLKMAKSDVIIMHPGPINRGVEIDSLVADGSHSVILQQVSHGIGVRMAIITMLMGNVS